MSEVLRITAKRDGFRRSGIAHPATPTDHPIGRFTEAQIAALEAEPQLVVQRIVLDAPPGSGREPGRGQASPDGEGGGGQGGNGKGSGKKS